MALETRFKMLQFIRRHSFQNLFTSKTKSSHNMQLPSCSRTDRQSRIVHFADSPRFAQNELARDSYTVWKSKCLVLNAVSGTQFWLLYKELCSNKEPLSGYPASEFPDFNFSKTQVLYNQSTLWEPQKYIYIYKPVHISFAFLNKF